MKTQHAVFTAPVAPSIKTGAFRELLTAKDRAFLIENGTLYSVAEDTVLCQQNKVEDLLYVVLMGEVEIVESVNDVEISVGKLTTGDLVGEIGALFSVPRIASVVTTSRTVVLKISTKIFKALLNRSIDLQDLVYQQLYERSLETALYSTRAMTDGSSASVPDLSKVLSCWQIQNNH